MSESANERRLDPVVGPCLVMDANGRGWSGTVLVRSPNRREKEEPWFFFDEPRFPWRVRDLERDGFKVVAYKPNKDLRRGVSP